jgi:TetR/AcrR family transcriptional repressor of nem operon
MRYDPAHKQRTRNQILTEAASAIRVKGPEAVSVADVMNKLGLTHGGFYAHFASKDELVAEAIGSMFEQGAGRFNDLTGGLEPDRALLAYTDWYLSGAHRDSPSGGCPLAAVSGDLPRLPQSARERYGQGVQRLTAGIASLLRRQGCAAAESQALSILSELVGALVMARAVPDRERSDAMLRSARKRLHERLASLPGSG